jgi:hypothetical protein
MLSNFDQSDDCENNKVNYSVDLNIPSKIYRESKLEEVLMEHF